MTKYQLTKPGGPWDYPTLGFSATNGAILDGTLSTPAISTAPDAYWAVYGGGSAETGITRYGTGTVTPTPEVTDGWVLAYDGTANTYTAQDLGDPESLVGAALSASIAANLPTTAADPQHQSVILFGTSQENVNGLSSETVNSTAAEWRPLGRGWAMWAHAFLDHQFYTTVNAGVSGERYDQMLARMSTDVLAYPSDWLWIGGAPNDVEQDRAAALVIADLDDMVAAGVADGRRVLVFTTAPTTSTTGARVGRLATINAHVATLPDTYPGRVVVADVFTAIDDGTSQPKANLTHDGTHYSDVGAMLVGRLAAEAVRAVTPPPVAGSRSEVGRPSYTQILTNPFLTNSGWTVSSPATGSWAEPGAVSLTYSGAGADNDQGVSLSSPLTTGFAAGQHVRFRVHCEWRVGVPVGAKSNIGPQAYIWPRRVDNSFDVSSYTTQTGSSECEIPNLLPTFGRCTIQTPWYLVDPNIDRLYLYMYFSGISAGWVKFSQPEFLVKA